MAPWPGVNYAALYIKTLEIQKAKALKLNQGHFDANIHLSSDSKVCIEWWDMM